MLYVILTIFAKLSVQQTLRFSQKRRCNQGVVVAANYVMGAVVYLSVVCGRAALGASAEVLGAVTWRLVGFGVANGALYFLYILVILACYQRAGVGITVALMQSALIVPILVSWLLWGEQLSAAQWTAAALIPVSAALMRPGRGISPTWNRKADVLLVLNFVMAGTVQTLHKAASVSHLDGRLVYGACVFMVASVISTGAAIRREAAPRGRDLAVGATAGLFNCLTLLFLLAALNALGKAVVVLPTINCSTLCLNVLLSWIAWKERLRPRQIAGLGVSVAVVILANQS